MEDKVLFSQKEQEAYELIKSIITVNKTSVEHPVAIVLGG